MAIPGERAVLAVRAANPAHGAAGSCFVIDAGSGLSGQPRMSLVSSSVLHGTIGAAPRAGQLHRAANSVAVLGRGTIRDAASGGR